MNTSGTTILRTLGLACCLALGIVLGLAQTVPSAMAAEQNAAPKAGDVLPDLPVTARLTPAEAASLGLPANAPSFRLSQIKARVLLVEVFSMYCPRCQAAAPAVNRLHERLAASPRARELRFVALGAGNTPFEVDFYRQKYRTAMPLLPDEDYSLHKAFRAVGTPAFFVLQALPGGRGLKVLLFHEGQPGDEDAFFEQVLTAAKP